jgi:hypothetical protein
MKYQEGIRILKEENGEATLDFIKHSSYVYASPIEVRLRFPNISTALNFLILWDRLAYVKFWR